jgi:hypothetical protein
MAPHDLIRPTKAIGLRTHLTVFGAFLLLTLLLTYPITVHFASEIPFGGDAWQHIWNLWWIRHAVLDLHTSPYFSNLIFYPDGANLYFHTLALTAGLTGIPLQALGLNLLETYNLIMMSTFVLAGYSAFLLCHYLTRNVWASFVGGFVFSFSPYHFAHLIGHMNLASLQWIPFYVLLLLRAIDEPGTGHGRRWAGLVLAAGAGVLLAVNTYTDWLYGIFLALFTGLLIAWRVLVPGERRALARSGVGWLEGGLRVTVALLVYVSLVSPVLLPTLREAQKGYAQQPPEETLVYSADLVQAFVPSAFHPLWGKLVTEQAHINNPSEQVLFLGFATLGLAALAVWRLRRERQVLFWAFAALSAWALSLGPVLQVLGRSRFTAFGVTIPLPYLLLYKLPLLNIMRTPARLTVLTMLALAVLVAFGLDYLSRSGLTRSEDAGRVRRSIASLRNRSGVLLLGLPLLIAFEYLTVPFPTVPPGWGVPIYARIAQEPGRFALLELPLRPFGDYMAYQTVHGKPIVGGYLSRQPPYPTLERTPALRYLVNSTGVDDPLKASVAGGAGVSALRNLGIKYVIIRWWAFSPEEKAAMQRKLEVLLGRPPDLSYPADLVDAWQISK